jgi:kynurenine formamidase
MSRRVVDLTQTLGPATEFWPGSEPVERRVVVDYATDGLYGQVWRTPEHAGTHLDNRSTPKLLRFRVLRGSRPARG